MGCWMRQRRAVPSATNFTQSRPTPQSAPTHTDEVWDVAPTTTRSILHHGTDASQHADSILQQLSVRDRVENSDEFGI